MLLLFLYYNINFLILLVFIQPKTLTLLILVYIDTGSVYVGLQGLQELGWYSTLFTW